MRDQSVLQERFEQILYLFFPDLIKKNKIIVKFRGRSKHKFGHIKRLKDKNTEIVVNSLFRSPYVPLYVIDLTIAHELVHYLHGFQSPLPKQFKYPHQGGVVRKELIKRGLKEHLRLESKFVKDEWPKIFTALTSKPY